MEIKKTKLEYWHVDVFSRVPFSGNSLAVFPNSENLTKEQMRRITEEMRHFESIFLESEADDKTFRARVFDLDRELDFAGHPILGAAGAMHLSSDSALKIEEWKFVLNNKTVTVRTEDVGGYYSALLDQGQPEFIRSVETERAAEFAAALNLEAANLSRELPLEVVSTGLRYLILPLANGLEKARIVNRDFENLLASVGAEFAYVLDVNNLEGRHWNNDGIIEDIATGSGAGCVGAYLCKHRRVPAGKEFILKQGRFAGRPSQIRVLPAGVSDNVKSVLVGGDVTIVGSGNLRVLPAARLRAKV